MLGKAGARGLSPKSNQLLKSTSKEEGSYPGNLSATTQSDDIQERENSVTEIKVTLLVIYV